MEETLEEETLCADPSLRVRSEVCHAPCHRYIASSERQRTAIRTRSLTDALRRSASAWQVPCPTDGSRPHGYVSPTTPGQLPRTWPNEWVLPSGGEGVFREGWERNHESPTGGRYPSGERRKKCSEIRRLLVETLAPAILRLDSQSTTVRPNNTVSCHFLTSPCPGSELTKRPWGAPCSSTLSLQCQRTGHTFTTTNGSRGRHRDAPCPSNANTVTRLGLRQKRSDPERGLWRPARAV